MTLFERMPFPSLIRTKIGSQSASRSLCRHAAFVSLSSLDDFYRSRAVSLSVGKLALRGRAAWAATD